MASCILSMEVWLAVSVDFIFLNSFCICNKMLCLFTKDINLLYINVSKILEKSGKMDIDL